MLSDMRHFDGLAKKIKKPAIFHLPLTVFAL